MKSVLLKIAGMAVVSVLLGASCPPRDYYLIAEDNPFVLETKEATNVGGNEAILNAYFDITGIPYRTLTYGFEWGKSQDMDTEVECTEVTDGSVVKLSYSTQLTDLDPSTRYWFRSFVVFGSHIFYGEKKSFTTSEFKMIVDLGLSVKWASCNLGATRPTDYGDYYAWGEVEPKRDYSWETYKWCKGSDDSLTKYCTYYDYWGGDGMPDGKTGLDLSDDVAHIKLGGKWRMPTDEEWTELRLRCKWTWTNTNGANGYKVTGPNGNSIFLPAAGYRYDTNLYDAGYDGDYWSSSLYTDYPLSVWYVDFYSDNVGRYYGGRCIGQSVRPVSE